MLCHVQVAEEIWNKEKIPKASLCCGNVNKGFKIQKENRVEGEDGGWAVKRYNEILENIETMVNVMMTASDDDEETNSFIPNKIADDGNLNEEEIFICKYDLPQTHHELYDHAVNILKKKKNTWVKKSSIFTTQMLQNRTQHWMNYSKSEGTQGLFLRKKTNNWEMKYV